MDKNRIENPTPIIEQNPLDKRVYLECGLDRWLELVANSKWTTETTPEQEKIWKINQSKSILTDLVHRAQLSGMMDIYHYWPATPGHPYKDWFLPQIEKINQFCKQNDIPFAIEDNYIERVKRLFNRLISSSRDKISGVDLEPPPKDTKIYEIDPILIPFLPHIKQIESDLITSTQINLSASMGRDDIKKQVDVNPEIIQRILTLLDEARKSGSSFAIGDEAKEAIELYLENIEQKRKLYRLLKERGIKIPINLTYFNTAAIIECALFEKKFNGREFSTVLFSEELNYDYQRMNPGHEDIYVRKEEITKTVRQQIFGQDFLDLETEITQK